MKLIIKILLITILTLSKLLVTAQLSTVIISNNEILMRLSIYRESDSVFYQIYIKNISNNDVYLVDTSEYNYSTDNSIDICNSEKSKRTLFISFADFSTPYSNSCFEKTNFKIIKLKSKDSILYSKSLIHNGFIEIQKVKQICIYFTYGRKRKFSFISSKKLTSNGIKKGLIRKKLSGKYYKILTLSTNCKDLVIVNES